MPLTVQLVQPALEVAQDVHLLTIEVVKREELGEVKLSILKEGNDNACLECRDGHTHYATRIIQLQTDNSGVFKDLQTGDLLSGWNTL
jgi:hypothetical protein